MAVSSLEHMLDRLLETGLISSKQFKELHERKNPDDTLPSVAGVTRKLVTKGILTHFQAGQIADGDPERLILGEYVLLDLLGSGGMGEVYLARHSMMQRDVAVKLLVPKSSELIESIERFKREVRAAARLSHPNVVTALDAGVRDKQYYLVMEYVKGRNLASLVKSLGAVRLDRAIDYTIQAGQGLEYAHRQGVIHRDVKPSNLLLGEDGTVKVSDLGLSRILQPGEEANVTEVNDEGDGLTSSGMIMGTVDFMAPEQAVTPRDADERADIYGLGCTLYFLATGNTVFQGDTPMARLIAHRESAPPSIAETLPNAPALLDHALSRMLAKDPDDRYPSVSEALRDLRSCLREYQEGISSLPETEYRPLEETQTPRRSALALITTLAVIGLLVAGYNLLPGVFRSQDQGNSPTMAESPDPPAGTAIDAPRQKLPPGTIEPDYEPVNVLSLLNLETARRSGDGWELNRESGSLLTGAGDRPRLALPVSILENYWLSLNVRRLPNEQPAKGPFVVGLRIGSSAGVVGIDAEHLDGGEVSFIGHDPQFGVPVKSVRDRQIEEDRFVAVRIAVKVLDENNVQVWVKVGEEPPFEWNGAPTDIAVSAGWSTPWPADLFLASNNDTQFEVRDFRVGPGDLPPESPAQPDVNSTPRASD